MKTNRVDIRAILANAKTRRGLLVGAAMAIQAREGIDTTREQMEAAYDRVQREKDSSDGTAGSTHR